MAIAWEAFGVPFYFFIDLLSRRRPVSFSPLPRHADFPRFVFVGSAGFVVWVFFVSTEFPAVVVILATVVDYVVDVAEQGVVANVAS